VAKKRRGAETVSKEALDAREAATAGYRADPWRLLNAKPEELNALLGDLYPGGEVRELTTLLAALREMKRKGHPTLAICNVVGSSIAREADGGMYLHAGPEIGVASTKAYTLQILSTALIAVHFADVRDACPKDELVELRRAMLGLAEQAQVILDREDAVKAIAEKYFESPNALYLGRGVNLASAMEGALKLKEISYIHAEGYSAGEMKHGPIALVQPDLFTVAIAVKGDVYDKMIGNIQEIKARSGPVIGVAFDGDSEIPRQADDVIWVPPCPELLSPITVAIPLQILAYHIADLRGCHIDQPRNLAKTVTVE